jgi:hypothetical protein
MQEAGARNGQRRVILRRPRAVSGRAGGEMKRPFLSRLENGIGLSFVRVARNFNRGVSIRLWRLEAGAWGREEAAHDSPSVQNFPAKIAKNLRLENFRLLILMGLRWDSNSRFAIRNWGRGFFRVLPPSVRFGNRFS